MNTRRIKLIGLFVLFSSSSYCQEFRHTSGLFSGSAANTAPTETHIWAIQANPAMLPLVERREAGVAYCTNYKATDIACSRLNAGASGRFLSYGVSFTLFGNSHFRESGYHLCIAKRLNANHSLGIAGCLDRTFQETCKPSCAVYPEIAYWGCAGRLSFGVHIINPARILQRGDDRDGIFKLQGNCQITGGLHTSVLLAQTFSGRQSFSVGVSYTLHERYHFGIAFSPNENPLQISLQLPLWDFVCTYETTCNHYLGFSHTVALAFCCGQLRRATRAEP